MKIRQPAAYHTGLRGGSTPPHARRSPNFPREFMMDASADAVTQPYVLVDAREGVATVTLNRGDRFNALSLPMIAALEAALVALAEDRGVRVVVLAARGRGFCAGHDLKEMRAHPDLAWQRELFGACGRMMQRLTQLPQPVIARVHGIATAAGCQLVSMCDLAVAAETAKFALPGVNVGVFCSTPAVGVARNIARKRVMEMLLTGEMIDAATALDWGLVNRVVPEVGLDAAVKAFTDIIATRSPAVVALGKRTFYQQVDRGLAGAYETAGEAMACNLLEPDAAEGIDAFLAKRPPAWHPR
jgi:enoyl-CoA hydratase/carnithine racemase